jgi:hypothetical protein
MILPIITRTFLLKNDVSFGTKNKEIIKKRNILFFDYLHFG